eukprot:jgi/Undpi1/7446/HiC_scaffold_22.g09919.m1
MFDCHAHLTDPSLREGLDDILAEAEAAGVSGIVSVSETLEDAVQVVELCARINSDPERRIRLHPSIGMHPEKADLGDLEGMLGLIDEHSDLIVCVGEIGLDYSRHLIGEAGKKATEEAKEIQREVFSKQARRAEELGLAVNVHSRSAGHHAITLLRDVGVTRAVLHAFDGKPKYAVEAAKAGYLLSVPPIVCRSPGFQSLVKAVPLQSLLLETDSPALAPVKNELNKPENVRVACEWIASLKGVSVADVVETTNANARRIFPRAFPR